MKTKLTILFLLLATTMMAQELVLKSFSLDEKDLTARTNVVYDANGDPCALVKVGLVVPNATFRGDVVQVKKQTSEYWVYLVDGATYIEIQAPGYQTFTKDFDVPLKKHSTYRLVLNVPQTATTTSPTIASTAFFILSTTPDDCEVYINDEYAGNTEDGQFSKRTTLGTTLQYKVSKNLYHSEGGTVTVSDKQTRRSVSLQPAFGAINVTSIPSGAKVSLDGEGIGTTPMQLQRVKSGKHTITVIKDRYAPVQREITVTDNQQSEVSVSLSARFANITINTLQGAEIKVDDESKGTGSSTLQLMEGIYEVEISLNNHHSAKKQIEVVAGQDKSYTINPTPIYGSITIESSPIGASIALDGKDYGTTPNVIEDLPIGDYGIKLSKQGYADFKATVHVQENQETSINATMKKVETLPTPATPTTPSTPPTRNTRKARPGNNSGPSDGKVLTVEANGVQFKMVYVKGGTFTMGATPEQGEDCGNDEYPTHQVTLSDYYIGQTEVTQALWKAVMGTNPSNFTGEDLPVEEVSWHNCQQFISELNSITGNKFSLPTEAQWEYAARGGAKSKANKYSGNNKLNDVAWYFANSDKKTHAVATKQSNELGIYDMSGNVMEWCSDQYGSYEKYDQTNPIGNENESRITIRGGCWDYDMASCRISYRNYCAPDLKNNDLGFRLVLVP